MNWDRIRSIADDELNYRENADATAAAKAGDGVDDCNDCRDEQQNDEQGKRVGNGAWPTH